MKPLIHSRRNTIFGKQLSGSNLHKPSEHNHLHFKTALICNTYALDLITKHSCRNTSSDNVNTKTVARVTLSRNK